MTTDVINDQSEHDSHDGEHHDHKMTGLKRWLYTTNHKDIGPCTYGSHLLCS